MAAILAIVVAGAALMSRHVGELIAPAAPTAHVRVATADQVAEQAYLNAIDPYLGVVIAEGRRLAELGEKRSRNVIELGVRMDRFREASAHLQSYVAANHPPEGLQAMVTPLLAQLRLAEQAIDDAVAAVRRLDWGDIAVEVDQFGAAIGAIENLSGLQGE